MRNSNKLFLLTGLLLTIFSVDSALALTRTSRVMNMLEFFGGASNPVGSRNGLPNDEFILNNRSVDVDSEDIYDNSFHLGLSYGQLRNTHFLVSLGFRFTKHNVRDTIPLSGNTVVTVSGDPSFNQFDIDFSLNYMIADIMQSSFTPFFGLGAHGGLTAISEKGFETDHEASFGLSTNFGADLKLWTAEHGRSFVTLSSINSYNFYGSNDRPKYLNLGLGIRFWLQP